MTHLTLPLNDLDVESLERATLDAVAPAFLEAIEGWLLPFDTSTIGRAKSAVPLRHHRLPEESIATILKRYDVHVVPAAFRVADLPALAPIHEALRQQGFLPEQPTLVQVGSVSATLQLACDAPAPVFDQPTRPWAAVYTAPGFDPVDGAHRVQALSRSPCIVYAVVNEDCGPVASGTASISRGWAGIHGMRTIHERRRQALATRVLVGLAGHAHSQNIERMFLQAEEENAGALALYRRAGFVTAWRYHYWRRPKADRD